MNTQTPGNEQALRAMLKQELTQIYGFRGEIISREDFLHHAWNGICSFTQGHRNSPLIQEAVREHRDFCARAYVLLTIQYGAFTGEADIVAVLKDLIGLLGKDLIEEEMRICEYASQAKFPYYPGLIEAWEDIQYVYREKYFDLSVLPPTPHLAYTLFTLNMRESIGKKMSPEEMFGKLSVLDGRTKEIHSLVRESQTPGGDKEGKLLQFKRRSD